MSLYNMGKHVHLMFESTTNKIWCFFLYQVTFQASSKITSQFWGTQTVDQHSLVHIDIPPSCHWSNLSLPCRVSNELARKVSRRFVPFFLGEKVKDVGTLFLFWIETLFYLEEPYKTNICLFHGTFPDLFCCSMLFETFQIYENIQSSLSRSSRTIISPIPIWPSSVVKGYFFPCQKAAAHAGMTFLHFLHFLSQRME